jgi:Phytanoyl-CoA dioxygenase (PhyH)
MPANDHASPRALSDAQIQAFVRDGFVRIDSAFPRELADEGRAIMWRDLACDEHDPATWTKPVIRLPGYGQTPFRRAANTPILHAAFDQLVGKGRWRPRYGLGTFPVRFPHPDDPGDAGWHVDLSFPGEDCDPNEQQDFSAWRVNIVSRGRALLMLFLFSDVSTDDAPTRIRVGSHADMARFLAPAGEAGMARMQLERMGAERSQALATGEAGTVYLCHPFLVHAAQKHRGTKPRFMAQPPLDPAEPFRLHRENGDYSPVEIAIRQALGKG